VRQPYRKLGNCYDISTLQERKGQMAKQQVIQSICDRCHTEDIVPLMRKKYERSTLDLPIGWLHVSGVTATSTVFEMDLCRDCKGIVMEAAGKAERLLNA